MCWWRRGCFPGIPEVLSGMAAEGWRFAVCTNKPERAAQLLLEGLGIAGLFAAIGGGDSFAARKPDPLHLRLTIEAAGGRSGAQRDGGRPHNDVQSAMGAG